MPDQKLGLFDGLRLSGLTAAELWLSYFTVGGDAEDLELEAYVLGVLRPGRYQHDLIAQALNEHFIDRGLDHCVGYYHELSAAD
jgi:hypothetical protein